MEDNQKLFKYVGLTPCEDIYKTLAFKDQFNFVGILENGGCYYKLDMADLMGDYVAKYFKIMN